MRFEALQVGELSKRTGLTVRTLHHYDEIGLLKPSSHTESGYRLYITADIARLQQILSLRQLGFSLDEIRNCLDGSDFSPQEVIRLHLARLQEQIESQQALSQKLATIASGFQSSTEISADDFLRTIEAITMSEKYFTPKQLALITRLREEAGDDLLRQRQEDWAQLIADIRVEMDAGSDPKKPKARKLARRWQDMVEQTTAGDPKIKEALKKLWDEQGDALVAQHGPQNDPRPVMGYMVKAVEALNQK
jgi:MerR family transcriptional regulator, thiopeptide resistance regulator